MSAVLVLASQSPRRAELLKAAGIPHVVRPARLLESRRPGEGAHDYVLRLAQEKAGAVECRTGEVVLAADTVVVAASGSGEQILEKPMNERDARRMLGMLSGRTHRVLTGFCLRSGAEHHIEVAETIVEFLLLTAKDVDEYIGSGEPFDKAGGYAIQGLASRYIRRIDGSYSNVVGLPVERVWAALARFRD